MFQHKMDPLVKAELIALRADVDRLNNALKACEEKLDALLADKEPVSDESVDGKKKPEPLAAMPGYIPPSRRKAQRIAAAASSTFTDRVVKGSGTTAAPEVDATD